VHFAPGFGGLGLPAGLQPRVTATLDAAGAPRPTANYVGVHQGAAAVHTFAPDDLKRRWLRPAFTNEEFWCQLFSEPGAGSDLAGLGTRAVRDGDVYVVNGQKIWTTFAHMARFGILIARTDADAPKHQGISYFVCPMDLPGIEIRPIVEMTGVHQFNEVFFDDVRLPAENLVGEENRGWALAKVTLGNERVSLSGEGALWGRGPTANDVIDLVRARGGTTDRRVRQQLARLYTESEVLRLIRLRTLSARLRGLEPGPEASVRKAMSDEHGQHVMEMAKNLGGAHGMLADRGPFGEPDSGMWHYGYLYARALTIGGGTSEVQRNILGEKVLGLPRDPS
jgi:alkylation response protein AidB-like acyl-CoA dehydrogenase